MNTYIQVKSLSFHPRFFEDEVNEILARLILDNENFKLIDIKHHCENGWENALIIYETSRKRGENENSNDNQ